MTTWEIICREDAEKPLTICMCVSRERGRRGGRERCTSRSHEYCISLFDGCVTHFHVSSTNSTVTFFLLSVIFQTADPDNYPRETPDQKHLILSAARLHHTHWFCITLIFPSHNLYLMQARNIAPLISSNGKIIFTKCLCHLYLTHFVMSICWCTVQLLQCCCRVLPGVLRRSDWSVAKHSQFWWRRPWRS